MQLLLAAGSATVRMHAVPVLHQALQACLCPFQSAPPDAQSLPCLSSNPPSCIFSCPAVYLVQQQAPQASELLLGTLCLLAAGASFLLPYETKGLDLHQLDVLDGPEGQQQQQQQQRGEPAAGGLGAGGGGKQRVAGGHMLSIVDGTGERGFGDGAERGDRGERDPLLAL